MRTFDQTFIDVVVIEVLGVAGASLPVIAALPLG
jgi:hypothetical protein